MIILSTHLSKEHEYFNPYNLIKKIKKSNELSKYGLSEHSLASTIKEILKYVQSIIPRLPDVTITSKGFIDDLIRIRNNYKDKDVRIASVQSLGKIGRARSKEVLRHALNDDSSEVRSHALGALSFLRDTSAVEPLLKALRDEDKEVRWDAAESLGYLGGGNRVAERMIWVALQAAEDGIREEAAHALERMKEEKEHEILYSENWEG